MKIIIVGAGKLGRNLTKRLVAENHDIVVVDVNENLIQEIVNECDVLGYSGNGASYDTLVSCGAEGADLLIAVTNADEVNILACLVAKKLKVKQTIARVRNPEYSKQVSILNDELGISTVINPEQDAATEIVRILQFPSALKVETFANNKVNLVEIKLEKGSPLIGMSLEQMREKYDFWVLVTSVTRGTEVVIPNGSYVLKENDNIYLAGTVRQLMMLFKQINLYKNKLKSAMIIGGSRVGYYVAKELLRNGVDVKIIEQDKKKCEELASSLDGATIICGDATDQNLLKEEGVDKVEACVTLTGMDETNIILSAYAKSLKCPKIITKVNNEHYLNLLGSAVQLDSVITPKIISSDIIVRYIRGMDSVRGESECQTMYHLANNKVEALEFIVGQNDDKIINLPIKNLKIKKSILLVSIIHENNVLIPTGNDRIYPNDTVIIVSPHSSVRKLEDILE